MNELEEKLAKIRASIKALVAIENLSDEDAEKLDSLNKEAVKLQSKIDGQREAEKADAETAARIEREKREAVDAAVKAERAKHGRLPSGDAPYQAQFSETWKYDNLDASELSIALEMQSQLAAQGKMAYPSGAAVKAMALKVAELKPRENTTESLKAMNYVKNAFKLATNTDATPEAVSNAVKAATDPMYTGGAGIGLEWIGTAYSSEIWEVIRSQNLVARNIPSDVIPDGYSSKVWPIESTDFTWYKVAEATASDSTLKVPAATVTASQLATGNKTISVGKLGARGIYTGELTEDSLIAFAPNARAQLQKSGDEILESLILDGDVETSANKNINNIDGTPNAADYYLIFDGFRKLALVTNTANSLSAAGSLQIDDFLSTLKLMGTAGLAGSDPSKCAFIVDGNVYYAMAKLPEVKTKDVNSAATVENGFVNKVYGVGVIPSWQIHRASAKRMTNNAGKISGTDSNNTLGAVVAVRWDQWKQAYKRRMTMEVTRIANADSYEIVALMRYGLAYRDTEASAVLYNVGV